MSELLKPCPFCGGEAALAIDEFTDNENSCIGEIYSVQCCNCIACTKWDASSDNAIAAWNRRVNDGAGKDTEYEALMDFYKKEAD